MNYFEVASYHRPYENNSKFELKPYSITFVSNINNYNFLIYDNDNLKIYPNPSSGNNQYIWRIFKICYKINRW